MADDDSQARLSRLTTQWTLLFEAHAGNGSDKDRARHRLVERYYGAIYRYLLGIVGDPCAADDLSQEFACALLRGDFKGADPDRGRFRDYLKASVRHLVHKHWGRLRQARERPLEGEERLVDRSERSTPDDDAIFLASWREELLARAWDRLKQVEQQTGAPHHWVLRLKTERPELRSADLAERAGVELGKPMTAVGVRQALHRARQVFGQLLVEEVAQSLTNRSPIALEQELIELGLHRYCRMALNRWDADV